MINSNKEAGAGFIAAVRSLSKQFPCPEKTNGDIKPGLLLVSLDQVCIQLYTQPNYIELEFIIC